MAKMPSLYSGAWSARKNCGPTMLPTAYATATDTDEKAFLVVPAVLDVTSERHSTQGASVRQLWDVLRTVVLTVEAHEVHTGQRSVPVCDMIDH